MTLTKALLNGGRGDVEQEVCTPAEILARVRVALGGVIALDPCSPTFTKSDVDAERVVRDPRFEPGAVWNHSAEGVFRVIGPRSGAVLGRWDDDGVPDEVAPASMLDKKGPWHFVSSTAPSGLGVEWPDRTFANPPFLDLEEWLAKAREESATGSRVVVLAPWRSHRRWFLDALVGRGGPRPTITLEPAVKFRGHKTAFPAPVALIGWGCIVPPSPLGVVGQFLSQKEIAP